MKVTRTKVKESLHRLKAQLLENNLTEKYSKEESPLRSELFSTDQLEQYGKSLASSHILDTIHAPNQKLLTRLAENEVVLLEVHNLVTKAVKANRQITPAGEWLLDNFYLIEEHIRTGKRHLPKGYSRELPLLLNGPSAALPRVYDIALESISHGDGQVDPESFSRFVASYQTITSLKLGELWAIPIMLRLALIENLRRVATRVAAGTIDRDLADTWADQMTEIVEKDPKNLILVIADMARSNPPMTPPFVMEFARRLQGKSPALAFPLTWIEQRLSETGLSIEQLVQTGTQQQAADQVSISNSIDSLRFLGAMDWREFVESMSEVEQVLREDPADAYSRMDFSTRDQYRHVIENIAKHSPVSEIEVTHRALHLAHKGAMSKGTDDRTAHVGFYLIDKGLRQLERLTRMRFSASRFLRKIGNRVPLLLYTGSIALLTLIFAGVLVVEAYDEGIHGWPLAMLSILLLLCTSHLAVAMVNWLATLMATPQPLPRMDFSEGIPTESRSLVVIPTMLMNTQNIEELIEALEVRFLANQDDNLHFGLLTDFRDADKENLPEDEPMLQLVRQKIEELNEKYRGEHSDTFFLFHRPRRWNAQERIWMGYERKRGKLSELNSFLRGGSKDLFSLVIGNTEILQNVKFVITLDSDTQLPRDSARQFVGTMTHPLNRARYDKVKKRVCEGYGILQPRLAVSLPGTNRSRYARLYGSEPGIDPYTRAVSDVYQDLFGEGSFIGKGIYDVDAFEMALGERFPENRILSHDLLEGCYARAGLLSDVQLFEEYPFQYCADVNRRHRWIRGDWQLIQWLLPLVPGHNRRLHKNPLSGLSRWKIFDNLRRSVIPLALSLILLLGWTVLSHAWFWTLSILGIILIPSLIISIVDIINKPVDLLPSQHFYTVIRAAGRHFAQAAFTLICLPHEAFYSMDAIVRTLWRILVTHKRLLVWNQLDGQDRNNYKNLIGSCRIMLIAPFIAASAMIYLALFRPTTLIIVSPILILWFISPAIAWWISRPLTRKDIKLTTSQYNFLRELSRKTWSFFEFFVGPDDNWLPPDNYQEYPVDVLAHRTSPTNIGLALLANLSAHDFGYISTGQLIERTANTLRTMEALEQHRGHFYNWYDTQSLKPLHPFYISSVDSGNLAGHLLTLVPGLLELPNHKILEPQFFEGISDTLRILADLEGGFASVQITQLQKDLKLAVDSQPATLKDAWLCIDHLAKSATEISERFISDPENQASWWAHILARQCRSALDELTFLAPWLLLQTFTDEQSNFPFIDKIPTLHELALLHTNSLSSPGNRVSLSENPENNDKLDEFRRLIAKASSRANERIEAIQRIAAQSRKFANMEYDFLYDKARHLQAVGYNVNDRRRDSSYYDLLASEARLSSFVAIAQGQLPQESWFALGRLLTTAGGDPILLSWSGSMFEYLMPLLVMPTYENTLLDQTYKALVKRQIEYGKQRGVPWGISESGYNTVDVHLNYQYRTFGVPGLGLKRGLAEDLVISPYASMLALMVMPEEACFNLQRLVAEGLLGKFGFYEAIDYTTSRLQRGQTSAVVRSFMAHHEGISLLSLAYLILDRPMQKRFESDPLIQSTMLLLQERIPRATTFYSHTVGLTDIRVTSDSLEMPVRVLNSPDTPIPEVHLLSNGRYCVMVTNAGGGYSRWKDIAVTRWREDSTCDNWGTFCYIRDAENGILWSAAYQPTLQRPEKYEAIFSMGRAEFRRRDHDFDTHTKIVVSPEDDIELRRVHINNRSKTRKVIEVTSYAEVVLTSHAADAIHPAFNNLFVQTEIIYQRQAILCNRRPRSVNEQTPWMFHLMAVHGVEIQDISYETNRMQFIGHGSTVTSPQAIKDSKALAGSQGSVLDPIVSIQYQIILGPEESATIDIVSGIGETREAVLNLVDKYQDRQFANRVFEMAWTHSQVVLRQINATESDAQLYGRLASSIIYANSSMRADTNILIKNRRGQSGLWGYSISGDLPIILLQIEDPANINLVRQLVQAHAYWRLKGLAVDLVIWNEDRAGYRQLLQEQIMGLIAAGMEANIIDRPGGIFVRPADQISNEDRILIQTVARVIISDTYGTLPEQIGRRSYTEITVPRFKPTRSLTDNYPVDPLVPRHDLIFFNGIGGFTSDGREYVITTSHKQVTPVPWVNVLANPGFGSVISENGLSYTWSENAHEFRLTPWHNDPVSDSSGEAFYIRDEESGHFWSPTPLPSRGINPYASRHGFGYSVFEHMEDGILTELWVYVAIDAAVKFSVLKVRNKSGRMRRLSAIGYVEWVLGDLRSKSSMHVITEADNNNGALYARNHYISEFAKRVAFFQTDDAIRNFSCDRTEFLGRNGTLQNPAAMTRSRLSGKKGAALDPCAAIQVPFELADEQEREIIFKLGVGQDIEDTGNLVRRFRGSVAARSALEAVWQYWNKTLGAVQVDTSDQSLNILTNGWLLYQTLACRIWARSGYYQSGGAYGFRDQLQDGMSLIHSEPHLLREHLLLFASRQFQEGDVQHWWHPPIGYGVRTHCSDDYLWLPLATCRYVLNIGDTGVLDEQVHFLTGHPLNEEDDSYYDLPNRSEEAASLYQHCVRAILRGLRFGNHGLPLMGTGDWNDGMNMVGRQGKGESVWLGFLLYEVLMQFTHVAEAYGDLLFVELCQKEAKSLRQNIEQSGWDGEWYRRAFFDDGSPLGSAINPECQIDSIAQSWAVLSGAGDVERSKKAMTAVDKRLVRHEYSLIQLMDPPFDKSTMNPGYIKGYVPGVRENGGQYTHAAIWAAMAFAKLGDSRHAWELLTMINPINHANSPESIATYKVEPYVMAADVYALPPHIGRGGWTWYTGSAGWMYRFILESLLGLRREAEKLFIEPCIPVNWKTYKVHYRYRETVYHIKITQVHDKIRKISVTIDGIEQPYKFITLVDDRKEHTVDIRYGVNDLS